MTKKVQVFVRKKKCTGMSTLIFDLNQMNSDKIMDGRIGFEVKLFIHFMKISSWKDENFEVISLLLSILLWNFNFWPKCLPVKISGSYYFAIMKIIFKQSFYPRTLYICYLIFLSQNFLNLLFHSYCKEYSIWFLSFSLAKWSFFYIFYKRSIVLLCILVISKRCMT